MTERGPIKHKGEHRCDGRCHLDCDGSGTQPGSAASEVCGARSVNCTCILPPDHGLTTAHRCEHGSWGRLDPAGERAYYALIDAGFDETDAERATEIVLKEAARGR